MYEVYGTQDQADYKPDISDNDHAMIKKALIAEGKDPTQENIMARYNRKYGLWQSTTLSVSRIFRLNRHL